jgi:hypothetical protein
MARLVNSDVLKPGDQVNFEFVRGVETMQVAVTLGEAQPG